MARQGKQMRVGAREGLAYHSVKLANGNRYEVDFTTIFRSGKALYPFNALPCLNYDLFWHKFMSVICAVNWRIFLWTMDTNIQNF